MMRIIKNKKNWLIFIFVLLAVLILFFVLGKMPVSTRNNLIYAATHPQYSAPKDVACKLSYKTYEMLVGGYSVLTKGNKSDSSSFPGFAFFEYFFPNCPDWNTDDRPKLFEYKRDGGFYIAGNMVSGGNKSIFSVGANTIKIMSFAKKSGSDLRDKVIEFMDFKSNGHKIELYKKGVISEAWKSEESDNFVGPSLLMGSKHSGITLRSSAVEYTFSNRSGNRIIKTNLSSGSGYSWEEYALPAGGAVDIDMDGGFYIADKKNKKIIKYSTTGGSESLGNEFWYWSPSGLAVAPAMSGLQNYEPGQTSPHDGDKTVYVTDSSKNRIIHTEIDGENWGASYDNEYWDYYTRLFITGEEGSITGELEEGSDLTEKYFIESGYDERNIKIVPPFAMCCGDGSERFKSLDHLFGDESLYFNGQISFMSEEEDGLNLGSDNFLFDLWVKPEMAGPKVLASFGQDFFLRYYKAEGVQRLGFFVSRDSIGSKEGNPFHEMMVADDISQGEWHHIALRRDCVSGCEKSDFTLYVDGEEVDNVPELQMDITGEKIILGAVERRAPKGVDINEREYFLAEKFVGKMDNIRLLKGYAANKLDERVLYPYYFSDPQKIEWFNSQREIVVADAGSDRIVVMNEDFTDWRIFGEIGGGSGAYNFKNPTDIDIGYDNGSYQFYIADKDNQRIVKTDLATLSRDFNDLDFSGASWETLDLSDYFNDSPPDFYEDNMSLYRVLMDKQFNDGKGEVKNFYTAESGLGDTGDDNYLNIECECPVGEDTFGAVGFKLPDNIANRLYEGKDIYVSFDVVDSGGNIDVQITKKPGQYPKTKNANNSELNLIDTVSGSEGAKSAEFKIPARTSIEWGGDTYLTFSSCDSEVGIDNIQIKTLKEVYPSAVAVNGSSMLIADSNNAGIIKADSEMNGVSCCSSFVGGKNPEEWHTKSEDHNEHKIKFVNPIEIISSGGTNYILDGVSQKDFSIYKDGEEVMNFFGTEQPRDVNVEMLGGEGLDTKGLDVMGIFDIWKEWHDIDKVNTNSSAKSGELENKIWVGYNLGPAVAYCGEQENEAETFDFSEGDVFADRSCGKTYYYEGFDDIGQDCHRSWWQAGDPIDVGTVYEDNLYGNATLYGSANPYESGGSVSIDCHEIAERNEGDPGDNAPVPYSECVGQWDWYEQWPNCTYYVPEFDRVRVCDEYYNNCYPIDEGQTADDVISDMGLTESLDCDGGAEVELGNCVSESGGECGCPPGSGGGECNADPPLTTGQCRASTTKVECERCNEDDDDYTCNEGECERLTVEYENHCSCTGGDCETEHEEVIFGPESIMINSVTGATRTMACPRCEEYSYDNDGNREKTVWGCFECEEYRYRYWCEYATPTPATCPGEWEATLAEDCCKKWHWECQAACVPDEIDCFEGHAVRWRDDYKEATIRTTGGDFTLQLFYDRTPVPYETEVLIKNIEQGKYDACDASNSGNLTYNTSVADIASLLINGGVVKSGLGEYDSSEEYIKSMAANGAMVESTDLSLSEGSGSVGDGDDDDGVEGSDDDGDGVPNTDEDVNGNGDLNDDDTDGDGTPNYLDDDDDGDGIPTADEGTDDDDGDGIPNYLDDDDGVEGSDSDGDGVSDNDEDVNGNGDLNDDDTDGDGTPNYLDTDDDGDGVPTADEGTDDTDGDNTPNYLDTDDDGDGVPTADEGTGDDDGDDIPNYLDDNDSKDEWSASCADKGDGEKCEGGYFYDAYKCDCDCAGDDTTRELVVAPPSSITTLPWACDSEQGGKVCTYGEQGMCGEDDGVLHNERWLDHCAESSDIVNEDYAIKYCDDLVLNGYSDWYLPAPYEMWFFYNGLFDHESLGYFDYGNADYKYWTSCHSCGGSGNPIMFDYDTIEKQYDDDWYTTEGYVLCVREADSN